MRSPRQFLAILDVGHGSCVVIKTLKGTAVIDTGRGSALLEFLSERRIARIDLVVVSHADRDHMGALAQLIASKKVHLGRIYLNTDSAKRSDAWEDLAHELQQASDAKAVTFKTSITTGEDGELNLPDARLEVLAPVQYLAIKGPGSRERTGHQITSNTISAVIRVVFKGAPVALLAGDVDDLGLSYLIKSGKDAKSPVLVFPHHGGLPGAKDPGEFARNVTELVAPDVIVFSTGRGEHTNPAPDVVDAVRKVRPKSRIVCTQMSAHCAAKVSSVPATHLTACFAQGREKGLCCAGTVIIDLSRPNSVRPTHKSHGKYIRSVAPAALCIK